MPNRNSSGRGRNPRGGSGDPKRSGPKRSGQAKRFSKDAGPRKERGSSANRSEKPERRDNQKKGERKFEKGPSYGLPFKRAYDKKKPFSKGPRRSDGDSEKKSFGRNSSVKREHGRNEGDTYKRQPTGKRPFNRSRDDNGEKSFTGNSSFKRRSRRDDNEGSDRQARGKSFGRVERTSKSSRKESGFFKKSEGRDGRKSSFKKEEISTPAQTDKIRLNKYIANSGVCSRREADELITMGLISVNGKTITELGYKVNPGDEVRYENKVLKAEKPVYILMNKPKGYLTTTDDPQERNTVMHIIGGAVKERIYPVGRLDRNTTGLLLLTNDGDLADKLMHPSYDVKKIYKVELNRALTQSDFQAILEGVQLEEGRAMVDDLAIISEDNKTVGVEIHIGWNRVVRRIFETLGYEVSRLDRSVYAGLDKKDLGRGQWRFLTKEEIVRLKHYR